MDSRLACRFDIRATCLEHGHSGGGDYEESLCTHAAAELERRLNAACRVLVRLGLVEHAGTWITREEADRISKDGP